MFNKDELYTSIYNSLIKQIDIESSEEAEFIHNITLAAREGVKEHITDLEEAVKHLQETVKRLSRVDT